MISTIILIINNIIICSISNY